MQSSIDEIDANFVVVNDYHHVVMETPIRTLTETISNDNDAFSEEYTTSRADARGKPGCKNCSNWHVH